jgi:hypothetical protein
MCGNIFKKKANTEASNKQEMGIGMIKMRLYVLPEQGLSTVFKLTENGLDTGTLFQSLFQ